MLVRALLEMPELRLSERVGGTTLHRRITHVWSTELPDPSRYLSGGELVISGLLWWGGARSAEVFVRALAEHGAAVLAASAADLGRIPAELVSACERHRLALLEVPPDLSFSVITERVVLGLADERGGSGAGRRRLLATMAAGGGLSALLSAGAEELSAACWVRSATGRVVAGGPQPPPHTEVDVPGRAAGLLLPWCLVVAADPARWQPDARRFAGELADLVALERGRAAQALRAEGRAAEPLLRLVAQGAAAAAELAGRAAAAGMPEAGPLRVIVAEVGGDRHDLATPVLEEVLDELRVPGRVGTADRQAFAVTDAREWPPDAVALARQLLRLAAPALSDHPAVLGFSGTTTAAGLPGAWQEARHAVRLGAHRLGTRRGARSQVVASEEIAAHRLLLAGAPDALRRSLRERLLGPVADYDAGHGGDLLGTLRVFLECSGSWTVAAARLHVHVNTLRYRIGRVEELLGTDLSEFANRVDLYLALHA